MSVNIVIHAQPSTSGSFIRLLQSLKKADFFSLVPPQLTIELPHEIDEPTRHYLQNFHWPPVPDQDIGNLLTLHHRIPQHGLTAEENSIRSLESFWPADPLTSHVLILSPQVELSPLFFHYLKYTMLEYKYSLSKAFINLNLLGISLDVPLNYLNGTSKFVPPLINKTTGDNVKLEVPSPFLWQAPNSNAQLYFGGWLLFLLLSTFTKYIQINGLRYMTLFQIVFFLNINSQHLRQYKSIWSVRPIPHGWNTFCDLHKPGVTGLSIQTSRMRMPLPPFIPICISHQRNTWRSQKLKNQNLRS